MAKVVVLGTGGTIAGRAAQADDALGYTAGEVGLDALLSGLPRPPGIELVAEQVAQIDSKDMSVAVWQRLALRCAHWLAQPDVRGIVVTHGTDTLEETAFFLQAVLAPVRPLVLTCAMRPVTALVPDGPQNLVDAITVAADAGAAGVLAVCAGVVHGAADVVKTHTWRLDAFGSGDAGPLAYVEAGRIRQLRPWPVGPEAPGLLARATSPGAWPRVELIANHADADGAIVGALRSLGVAGIVVAGTGNGSLSQALEAALLDAVARGIAVVRATRCVDGRVLPHGGDRLPDSRGLSPVKARIALQLELLSRGA